MTTKHTYDFMGGERYEIKTIPFDQLLVNLESYPGLYTWHIRPKKGREHEIAPLITALISQTQLEATIQGNLRLKYSGMLKKDFSDFGSISIPNNLIRSGFVLAQFPLYIGISTNLKNRLTTHYRQLLDQTEKAQMEDEDGVFAERISRVFREANISSLGALYVRIFELKDYGKSEDITKTQLKLIKKDLEEIEGLLNTAFNPVFGRR